MNRKAQFSIICFILFIVGFLALVLSLVGVKLSFLVWIDSWGGGIGLLIRLLMIVLGLIFVYVARTNQDV